MKIPRGIRNNNPGNLVITSIPWKGKVPVKENTDGRFEQFRDTDGVPGIVWGIRAMMMDVRGDIRKGKVTLVSLIGEYAPKYENDTGAYIKSVSKQTGIGQHELLHSDGETMCKLIRAMSRVENGRHWLTNQQINWAWRLI